MAKTIAFIKSFVIIALCLQLCFLQESFGKPTYMITKREFEDLNSNFELGVTEKKLLHGIKHQIYPISRERTMRFANQIAAIMESYEEEQEIYEHLIMQSQEQKALNANDVQLIKMSWIPVRKNPVESGILLFRT